MHSAKKLIIALSTAALLVLGAVPANAQATGTTDVDITFDPLLILYFYSDVTIDVAAAQLSDLVTSGSVSAGTTANLVEHSQVDEGTAGTVSATASGVTLTTTLTSPGSLAAGLDLTALDLTIVNAWAVRGLASSTSSQYEIEVQRGDGVAAPADVDLLNGTSSVLITDAGIRNTGGGAFTAEATAITNTIPALSSSDVGDIQLELDLSGLDEGGTHTSVGDTDFTITATHL